MLTATKQIKKNKTSQQKGVLSVDVEDWFHILDSPAAPAIERWSSLESHIEKNVERILAIFDTFSVKATFFWLGWAAERHKSLVRKCYDLGHEIASHGYGHVLAYKVGKENFKNDIEQGKKILEDIIGTQVLGFRAAGFGITDDTKWSFDVIADANYKYDSSVFPTYRSHGGMAGSQLGPYIINTQNGSIIEIPMSVIKILGYKLSLFGGGYLRLLPRLAIRWGIVRLYKDGNPLIVYIHPREIDPDHPRLPLSPIRRFKSYVNLKSTVPKLNWLCQKYKFCTMQELASEFNGRILSVHKKTDGPKSREKIIQGFNEGKVIEEYTKTIEELIG